MSLPILFYLSAAVGGALAVPLVILHLFRLAKFPRGRVGAYLEKLRRGPVVHRGGVPENTLRAFRLAKSGGASAVEVDLTLTKDGHPVLLHDDTVERTSDGRGRVQDLTLAQLKRLDFGAKFGPEHAGEKIPTLNEALDVCEELNLLLFLELKGGSSDSILHVVKKMFEERPQIRDRVCVITFWPWLLYKVRCMDSSILCGLVLRSKALQYTVCGEPRHRQLWKHIVVGLLDRLMFWSAHTWLWRLLGFSLMLPHKDDILKKRIDVTQWSKRGVELATWTVNTADEKLHFESLHMPYMTDSVGIDK